MIRGRTHGRDLTVSAPRGKLMSMDFKSLIYTVSYVEGCWTATAVINTHLRTGYGVTPPEALASLFAILSNEALREIGLL